MSGRDRPAGCPSTDAPASLICSPAGFKPLIIAHSPLWDVGWREEAAPDPQSCGGAQAGLCCHQQLPPFWRHRETHVWSKSSSGLIPSSGLTAAWALSSAELQERNWRNCGAAALPKHCGKGMVGPAARPCCRVVLQAASTGLAFPSPPSAVPSLFYLMCRNWFFFLGYCFRCIG